MGRRIVANACAVAAWLLACAPVAAGADLPARPVGPPGAATVAFAASVNSHRAYAWRESLMWRSDDAGVPWFARGRDGSSPACGTAVASPADPDRIYTSCGTYSFDGGRSWRFTYA